MIDNSQYIDYDLEDKLKKNYKDVPSTRINPTTSVKTVIDMEFDKQSEAFWKTHDGGTYASNYTEGVLSGSFNDRLPSFQSAIATIMETVKSTTRHQCEVEEKQTETLSLYLALLEQSFELLTTTMIDTLDDGIDGVAFMANLHGVINTFITTNIKKDK